MLPRGEGDLCYDSMPGNTTAFKLKKKEKKKKKKRDGIDIFLVNPSNLGHDS